MLFILCVRLTIKVKVGIPESFKVGWYPPKKTGSSHLKENAMRKFWLASHRMCHQQFMPNIAVSMLLELHDSRSVQRQSHIV